MCLLCVYVCVHTLFVCVCMCMHVCMCMLFVCVLCVHAHARMHIILLHIIEAQMWNVPHRLLCLNIWYPKWRCYFGRLWSLGGMHREPASSEACLEVLQAHSTSCPALHPHYTYDRSTILSCPQLLPCIPTVMPSSLDSTMKIILNYISNYKSILHSWNKFNLALIYFPVYKLLNYIARPLSRIFVCVYDLE